MDQSAKEGKVLCLPVMAHTGQAFLDMLTLVLAQVHCSACDAPCCRENPGGEESFLFPLEYEHLSEKYGKEHFLTCDKGAYFLMPCPFLKDGRCAIYEDRPTVCVLYPFQGGAVDSNGNPMIALSADCPEARRITRNVYTTSWWIRNRFRLSGAIKEKAEIKEVPK